MTVPGETQRKIFSLFVLCGSQLVPTQLVPTHVESGPCPQRPWTYISVSLETPYSVQSG